MSVISKPSQVPTICEEPFRETGRPILVLAGPGTGKTYQLARRIQYLVDDEGIPPEAITVITFTREATRGMRDRLNARGKGEFVEFSKQPKNILTMHSLGLRIIDDNAELLGLRRGVSVVADKVLKAGLMRDAAIRVGLREEDSEEALGDKTTANTNPLDTSVKIQAAYAEILKACNAVDFDDQIKLACDVLDRDSDALVRYKEMSQHLLIDEYQDINSDQDRLIQTLTNGQTEGLFAVGDDDQSVYGFRGGDPKFIRTFGATYPNASVLQLQVSRRCRKNIIDCALSVVSQFDHDRVPKAAPSYTESEPGVVEAWNLPSDKREAELIAKAITKKSASGDAVDFFVLVPTRNYVQPLVQAFTALGLAHEDGTAAAKNNDWNTLRTVKEWLSQPSDLITRHVVELIIGGRKTKMPSAKATKPEKVELRHEYARSIAELWDPVIAGKLTFAESLEEAAGKSEAVKEIADLASTMTIAYASADVPKFLEATARAVGVFRDVDAFYRCLELMAPESRTVRPSGRTVRILTVQSCKGLEADCVFIVGLEEGSVPRDPADAEGTAEEARKFFVAMTRARKELHLTHARKRSGGSSYLPQSHQLMPSCFVTGLPTDQCTIQYVQAKVERDP